RLRGPGMTCTWRRASLPSIRLPFTRLPGRLGFDPTRQRPGDRVPGELAAAGVLAHTVNGDRNGFSRICGDGAACAAAICQALLFHAAQSTRWRSRSKPALPYIWRLIVLSRFTSPSTGPLLHGSAMAARTAATSA